LQSIREQRILAVAVPEAVQLKGWILALSGIEEMKDENRRVRGTSQTWVCKLHVPERAVGYRVKDMYHAGISIPARAVRRGVARAADWWLPATTQCAQRSTVTCAGCQLPDFNLSAEAADKLRPAVDV
jgi:hypothetical protein